MLPNREIDLLMLEFIRKIAGDTRGTQTLELAIICAMIIIAIVASVKGVADENTGLWAVVSSRSAEAMAR